MRLLRTVSSFFRNKYLLTASCFVVWMLFFDRNDLFTTLERNKELRQIEEGKRYYQKEIAENSKIAYDLKSNPAAIEKYAREKYLMKRDNEDLFLIRSQESQ